MLNDGYSNINLQLGKVRVDNVATKIGSTFGEEGKKIGEKIDKATTWLTIGTRDKKW